LIAGPGEVAYTIAELLMRDHEVLLVLFHPDVWRKLQWS